MKLEIMTLDTVEQQIKSIIGEENFSKFSEYLFEVAFQKAPYQGIDPFKKEFSSFATSERASGMTRMYKLCNEGVIPPGMELVFPNKMQIKVSLRRHYFSNMSPEDNAIEFEPYVKRVFGKDNFNSLENWCFDYASREAEFFGKKGEDFKRIASIRRGMTIMDVAETTRKKSLRDSEVVFPDKSVIDEMVNEQMRSNTIVRVKMFNNYLLPSITYLD